MLINEKGELEFIKNCLRALSLDLEQDSLSKVFI